MPLVLLSKSVASFNVFSCLNTIRKLQKYGHLPSNPTLFRSYAAYGQFIDVRCAAIDALVDYTMSKYYIFYSILRCKEIVKLLFSLNETQTNS